MRDKEIQRHIHVFRGLEKKSEKGTTHLLALFSELHVKVHSHSYISKLRESFSCSVLRLQVNMKLHFLLYQQTEELGR